MPSYDLLHIHPAAQRDTPSFLFLPVGVFSLLNECRRAGFDVAALNEPLEMCLDPGFSLLRFLCKQRARVFSIDLHWHEHAYGAMSVASLIKTAHPESTVVVGGITASLYAERLLELCPDIDIVISGYGEERLPEILKRTTRPARGVVRGPAAVDLDMQDYVTRDFLFHCREYLHCSIHGCNVSQPQTTFWLKNGQGCPRKCSFCGGGRAAQELAFGNRGIIQRSPERVAHDICVLDAEGIGMTSLTQDPSIAPSHHWHAVHAQVRASGRRPGLYFEANGVPSRAFLADFARTFDLRRSAVVFTPMCASEFVRRRNGKNFGTERLWNGLGYCRELGIPCVVYFSTGLPFSSATQALEDARFEYLIRKRFAPLFVFRTSLTLDPASPMQRRPDLYRIESRLHNFDDYVSRTASRSHHLPYDALGYRASAGTETP